MLTRQGRAPQVCHEQSRLLTDKGEAETVAGVDSKHFSENVASQRPGEVLQRSIIFIKLCMLTQPPALFRHEVLEYGALRKYEPILSLNYPSQREAHKNWSLKRMFSPHTCSVSSVNDSPSLSNLCLHSC